VELAQWDVDGPFILSQTPQTASREIQTLAYADSSSSHQEKSIGFQVVGFPELILQFLIILWRQRPGKVSVCGRNIFPQKEVWPEVVLAF
jgi:hypothetical protein